MNVKNEKAQHCACEVDMEKEVDKLVKEGMKPTKAQHDKKKAEIESAFEKMNKKK